MLLKIFKQRFRRPLVTDGVPMAIMRPVRVPNLTASAEDVVVLVDDGNLIHFGHSLQKIEPTDILTAPKKSDDNVYVAKMTKETLSRLARFLNCLRPK